MNVIWTPLTEEELVALKEGDPIVIHASSKDAYQWHPSQRLQPAFYYIRDVKYVGKSTNGPGIMVFLRCSGRGWTILSRSDRVSAGVLRSGDNGTRSGGVAMKTISGMMIWLKNQYLLFKNTTWCGVKNAVRIEEMIHGGETEIKAGWEGTIVANADTPTPTVEFTRYGPKPVLAFLEVKNLEKV